MARSLLLLTVSTLALVTATAQAQNYVPPENYSGPNVVIDFGALDQAAHNSGDRWVVAPVEQEQLAPPSPPVKLHPPIVRKAMRMTPYVSPQQQAAQAAAQQPMQQQPPMMADAPVMSPQHEQALAPVPQQAPMARPQPQPMQQAAAPVMPAPIQQPVQQPPVMQAHAPVMAPAPAPHPMAPMPAAPLPPPTQFSARDMIESAPPAPASVMAQPKPTPASAPAPKSAPVTVAAAPLPKPTTPPPSAPIAAPVASSFSSKTGSMLAQARKNSSEKADRVNLASISEGPPLPMRNQAPSVSKPVTAETKPAVPAKPVIAAKPAPQYKPTPIAAPVKKPEPISDDELAPPALPPSAALRDLEKTDNNSMKDVIKQATSDDMVKPSDKLADKSVVPKQSDKPMQIASLPPTVSALRDTASDNKPAPAAEAPRAATQVSLKFAKDAGALDEAAKKDLDTIIKALKKDNNSRAQIRAYASGTPETSGQARRLSLTRALAARSYVVDQDIPATRLDIRALGNGQGSVDKPTGGNMDRVDISLVK